jgi:hypothetical protein
MMSGHRVSADVRAPDQRGVGVGSSEIAFTIALEIPAFCFAEHLRIGALLVDVCPFKRQIRISCLTSLALAGQ